MDEAQGSRKSQSQASRTHQHVLTNSSRWATRRCGQDNAKLAHRIAVLFSQKSSLQVKTATVMIYELLGCLRSKSFHIQPVIDQHEIPCRRCHSLQTEASGKGQTG